MKLYLNKLRILKYILKFSYMRYKRIPNYYGQFEIEQSNSSSLYVGRVS